MKLTKYGHACVVLEQDGKRLVIDPSELSPDYGGDKNIVGVVVTHEHYDHVDYGHLRRIIAENPHVEVFTTATVAKQLPAGNAVLVEGGQKLTLEPFALEFYGSSHAPIHGDFPVCDNVGVLVNDAVYYPGDSFDAPDKPVRTLLAPVSGPWLKVGEVIDFIRAIKPQQVIPTHEALNSAVGMESVKGFCKMAKIELDVLQPGESLNL